ncbi:MAG: LytTR family DNA-binding domain-containing protein [Rhodothermales bacterium]|nr:LytTR family DNA-binding domain-containing protein [Rhodothermales bacterium]
MHEVTPSAPHTPPRPTIRVLVVDDEPGARRRVERLIKREADVILVDSVGTGREALAAIAEHTPDLVFLDVQMPMMTGIEVVRNLPADRAPAIIFVTAFDQYAVKAFELAALDYLLKPFDDERFEQALARARKALSGSEEGRLAEKLAAMLQAFEGAARRPAPPRYMERIAVELRGQLRIVPVEQIDYINASGNYAYLNVGEEKLLVREQMQVLEERLPPDIFFRIHRSSIVRLNEIERLISNPGGDYAVRLRSGMLLKVSRNRWGELGLRLGIQSAAGDGAV